MKRPWIQARMDGKPLASSAVTEDQSTVTSKINCSKQPAGKPVPCRDKGGGVAKYYTRACVFCAKLLDLGRVLSLSENHLRGRGKMDLSCE